LMEGNKGRVINILYILALNLDKKIY